MDKEVKERLKELEDKVEWHRTDMQSHYNVIRDTLYEHEKRMDLLSNNVMGFVAELLKFLRGEQKDGKKD